MHTADEKQRHPNKTTPEQPRWTATAKGGEETSHADDKKHETHRCHQQARDAQEGARPFMLRSL
jgi:hypothetical protein